MNNVFLKAEWRNLVMANYLIDPDILKKYIPCRTELDTYDGNHFISLVGFLFKNTRVKGFSFPFHQTFEEVNLRFYVRYKENNQWKRGVVFMKEIVPKRMISFIANTIYNENYITRPIKHSWKVENDHLKVSYEWKTGNEWNYIKAIAEKESEIIGQGSKEEFITEHYWGYTFINKSCTGAYEVVHPKWKIHTVNEYEINCSIKQVYGEEFAGTLNTDPNSVFLAEGSEIKVMKGIKFEI